MLQYILSKVFTIIVFLIIFTIIVVSHEFGHYLLGRLNGIRVNEFAIGMGPVIFKKKLKSTILKIHLLPIGGACIFDSDDAMFSNSLDATDEDEDDNKNSDNFIEENDSTSFSENIKTTSSKEMEEDDDETKDLPGGKFQNAPLWGRIATVLAGPIFNFITAYIFCLFIVWFCGEDLPVLYDVTDGYPAQEAGLQAGDVITKIENHKVYLWREVSIASMLNYGEAVNVEYERDGVKYSAEITPKYNEENDRYYFGFVGGGEYISCDNLSVFKYTFYEMRYMVFSVFKGLAHLTSENGSMDDLAGPVGIANVIDDTIEVTSTYGTFTVFLNLLNIVVLLSVNLGIMNLLPFPAIDGGRLVFLLFELVTGKRVPPDKEGIVHLIGFILLFALMLVVFFNDISHIVKNFM